MAQKLTRHSAPKLTSNVYSKVTTEERAEAIGAISLNGSRLRNTVFQQIPPLDMVGFQAFYETLTSFTKLTILLTDAFLMIVPKMKT